MPAGLLSCDRCGRRLLVSYSGPSPGQPVYGVSVRTRCPDCLGASHSAASASMPRWPESSPASWTRWRAERLWRPSRGTGGKAVWLPVSMHISARLSGRSRSRDLTLPEWFAAFTATTGAALRQLRLHHPIPAPDPVSTSRWQERSSPILDTAF